jgi:NADH:ubiquinone oxidoreductase subunit F (NADH-binding)
MMTLPILRTPRSETSGPQHRSHYHLAGVAITDQPCQGLACFVARRKSRVDWHEVTARQPKLYCFGKCYAAPACGNDTARPHVAIDASRSVVLERIVAGGARSLASYRAHDGYAALIKAIRLGPRHVLDEVERSALRGRGGAGFSTAKKWRAVAAERSDIKYVVVNADEGDPGAYIDRFILEDDPHALIEASILAGFATGASRGTVYLRKEYPQAHQILAAAISEAKDAGYLGANVASSNFAFDLDIFCGEGSYVCGEETALLNSIEGKPPQVRTRPPYPTQSGLWGKPTLVNNVETLASIPWIVRNGGDPYAAMGHSTSRGTKVVSLNSLFRRPGLYEVEFGVSVRHIVEDLGGGLRDGRIRGLIIGGPLAGILPPHLFDTPFAFSELHDVGASVGHGGIIAFDEHTTIPELLHHVFEFAAIESCGKCTPCRIGSRVVEELLRSSMQNGQAPAGEQNQMNNIVSALHATSLCGLGTGLADFALSAIRYYPEEVARAFGSNQ